MKMQREVTTEHTKETAVVGEETQEAERGHIINGLGNSAQELNYIWLLRK